jgi:hypothetical protein
LDGQLSYLGNILFLNHKSYTIRCGAVERCGHLYKVKTGGSDGAKIALSVSFLAQEVLCMFCLVCGCYLIFTLAGT